MHALVQQSPEWHEMRRNKLGASDAPIIMNVSPWKTPYKLWEEKLGMGQDVSTYAMKRGLDMESEAREEFERLTGIMMFPAVLFHREHDFMMASLDGIDLAGKSIVEIKCPGKVDHECAMDGEVPQKYYPQLQHQLSVSELDFVFYFSYDGKSSKLIEVNRDDKYIKNMIFKEREFYRCIQELEAPELVERDFVQKNDQQWIETAGQWKLVNAQLKALEAEEKQRRKELIAMCGNVNSMGGNIKLSRSLRKGSVDYKCIPELETVDLEHYRKESIEVWRLSEC
jgi:putative phage-type endonuclease